MSLTFEDAFVALHMAAQESGRDGGDLSQFDADDADKLSAALRQLDYNDHDLAVLIRAAFRHGQYNDVFNEENLKREKTQ